ncbi:hypothetical protein B0H10DRAFT_2186753 [Mycena sp. CBHHK59/15]|nr:hypothetical protein B0H10DRAFT_2186753 [Mycena sp. CBHHK59/15]
MAETDNVPALPQELFDLIIDHLFDDVNSLSACSLVSASFLSSSRVRLFSHIKIGPQNPRTSIDALNTLFAQHPALAGRVHSLHLCDDIMRRHSWIEEYPDSVALGVAQLAPLLSDLSRLVITIDTGFVHWANVADALRTSVYAMLSGQTLTRLALTGLGLPLTLFAHTPALAHVALKRVTFEGRDFATMLAACVGSPVVRLQSLALELDARVFTQLVGWLLLPASPVDVSTLTALVCTLDAPLDAPHVQRLLDACAPVLERLSLNNVLRMLDLSAHTRLGTLCIGTGAPLAPRLHWLAESVLMPAQPLALVLRAVLPDIALRPDPALLTAADLTALRLFPRTECITLVLAQVEDDFLVREWEKVEREWGRALVDVSHAFVGVVVPGTGALRVLRVPYLMPLISRG